MRIALVITALILAGCKPPKFDSAIACPAFHADHVAVYDYDRMLGVLYPDHSWTKVDKTECVISQVK